MSGEARGRRGDAASAEGTARRHGLPAAVLAALVGVLVGAAACSGASVAGDDSGLEPIVGDWRGILLSGGGELPFALRVDPEGSEPPAVVINAGSEQPLVSVARQGAASYTLRFFDTADSQIVAKMSPDGAELFGYWRYTYEGSGVGADRASERVTQMPFAATKSDRRRFQRNDPSLAVATAEAVAAVPDLGGDWEVRVVAAGSDTIAVGTFAQGDEHVVADVIRSGMEGIYRDGLLRLSHFDGLRPLLLHARARADGTLEGTLWIASDEEARVTLVPVQPAQ